MALLASTTGSLLVPVVSGGLLLILVLALVQRLDEIAGIETLRARLHDRRRLSRGRTSGNGRCGPRRGR